MIAHLDAAGLVTAVDDLAELLRDATDGGSSVGFLAPLPPEEARRWWLALVPAVAGGDIVLWAARSAGRVVGTVQLRPSPMPNGGHRAELAKLVVHSGARRRGIGGALLAAAEGWARSAGLSLLVLDTEEGSAAEPLYRARGWIESGRIPDYAADPSGALRTTVYFYRRL